MESKLVFLLLLVCVSYTIGQDVSSSSDDDFYYPCQPQDNVNCIRSLSSLFFSISIEYEYLTLYVNRKTNNLVLSVDFDGINKNSSLTTFVVNQRGREPAVVSDYLNETYSAELTGVIPFRGRFGLKGSVVTVYNKKSIIPFDVGPNLITSSDPAISAMFAGLVGDIPSALQQLLLTKGPFFFYTYVQNYICDFGFNYTG
ncbi:hypothetical protein ABMA27_003284 [Loxostege sticticalis]|uniref:Uncharacterized protein n=1 Tax=Loxostege sticticalis TaxID=481309 RepID=A0ABR3HSL8_LOXSC